MTEFKSIFFEWVNNPIVSRLLAILGGLFIVFLLTYFVKKAVNKSIKATESKYKARKAVSFLSYFLMVAVVLFVYNDKLSNLGVALGVTGAGIAFALQELIMSVAGWINILLANTISVGQRIRVGDIKGDVIDIGVVSTTIMECGDWVDGDLYNGRIVSLANSFVFKEKIHNYSSEFPFLWDEIEVPVRIESDAELARAIFVKALQDICGDYAEQSQAKWNRLTNKFNVEPAIVQPMVTLRFDENWLTFTLRYIVDYKKRRTTKDLIFTRILIDIAKTEKVTIAASTLEVTTVTHQE